jgi:hypothetical protein
MPVDVRSELDRLAESGAASLGYPIARRDYVWLPSGRKDMSDPLGQMAYGGIKYWVRVPASVHNAQRDAEIARGGWMRDDAFTLSGGAAVGRFEYADFVFDGKPQRFVRRAPA